MVGPRPIDTTTWRCGPPPSTGQRQRYPSRFLFNLGRTYPQLLGPGVLSMFAGSSDIGVTTDFRPETGADIIAPFDAIPCPDGSFTGVLADPPYASHWQGQWHGGLPQPKAILREAARLVQPGGLIAILHIIVIPAYRELGVERVALHPVLAGPNNAIRVFNVFRRLPQVEPDTLATDVGPSGRDGRRLASGAAAPRRVYRHRPVRAWIGADTKDQAVR